MTFRSEDDLTPRDFFAALAMSGMVARNNSMSQSNIIHWSYDMADLFLTIRRERNEKENNDRAKSKTSSRSPKKNTKRKS